LIQPLPGGRLGTGLLVNRMAGCHV